MNSFKLWLFKKLLKSLCHKGFDQWELWKVRTKYGPVYIEISRQVSYPRIYEEL